MTAPVDASDGFGYSLAATGRTVLVGDPQANTVWIYKDGEDGFTQTRALQPPAGSDAAAYGTGFGHAVDMDESGALIIGAFAEDAMGVVPRKEPGDGFRRLGEVFVADDPEGSLTQVPGLDALTGTEAFGFSVARTGNHVAMGLRVIAGDQYGTSSVLLVDLASGARTRVSAPTPESATDFGHALASAGRILVIRSAWLAPSGGGVIHDLATAEQSVLAFPQETPRAGFSVATDGTRAVFGGEATVIAKKTDDAWMVTETHAEVNGTVATGGGRIGTLREASRDRQLGARSTTPSLDLTVIADGAAVSKRLAAPGHRSLGQWPHRVLAMGWDFAVVGRPTEVGTCKLAIVRMQEAKEAQGSNYE
ncbi:hypothetical protein [Roseovarius sp. TE539]|uniref:hypothetical protein n=1 Tax=Roseovarius sp. TE539 TaxID=2249812 RepID=UPI0015EF75F3|nr:hypothetical protein [Roseovarius sp. TE539]